MAARLFFCPFVSVHTVPGVGCLYHGGANAKLIQVNGGQKIEAG